MATYLQKLNELRLKSLRIIEDGLSDKQPEVVRFYNALNFMAVQPSCDPNQEIPEEPDALDAETIVDEKEKE